MGNFAKDSPAKYTTMRSGLMPESCVTTRTLYKDIDVSSLRSKIYIQGAKFSPTSRKAVGTEQIVDMIQQRTEPNQSKAIVQ